MKYRHLGKQGLKVSELALGSWMTDVSDTAKQDLADQSIKLAYEHGINYFDCADAYSGGAAERFLGKALKEFPRQELVLSSKVFFPVGKGVNDRGCHVNIFLNPLPIHWKICKQITWTCISAIVSIPKHL